MAAQHHLDLLLVAFLYGCVFTGALLVATSLVLQAFLAGALLVTSALAVSDACRIAGPAARAAHEASANLRLARALAAYAVLSVAVHVVLVVRAKVGALATRVRGTRPIAGCSTTWFRRCCVEPRVSQLYCIPESAIMQL